MSGCKKRLHSFLVEFVLGKFFRSRGKVRDNDPRNIYNLQFS
jgi:hypothetical protein